MWSDGGWCRCTLSIKRALPVLNLTPEDLRVSIDDLKVELFTLHKKQFQVGEPGKETLIAPEQTPPQTKMVFLVFDAAFTPYNFMAKAKSVAETVIAQSDKAAQYVLLSIEPFAGLNYICGPTRDLDLVAQSMRKYIAGKRSDYVMKTSDIDSSRIREIYPGVAQGIDSRAKRLAQRLELRDDKRIASVFGSSLMTLNLVLGLFREYSKVIYLYSCGIPSSALEHRTEIPLDPAQGSWEVHFTPSLFALDTLKMIGAQINKSGSLLFLVNPAGTRMLEADKDSGEESLRILANESGGRYYEGADKEVAKQVNSMEGGYYEISFPDKAEYGGQEMSFEYRSLRPEISIYSLRRLGRVQDYSSMTWLEREVFILNVLNKGPYAEMKQKVTYIEAPLYKEGGQLVCGMRLPSDLERTAWDVFKVWRDFESGAIQIEKDQVVSDTPVLEVRMKWKKDKSRHDIVLVHEKTGTVLVRK